MTRNIVHLPNKTAYDLWAPTYDTDGNILQSLDSLGLRDILLPRLLSSFEDRASTIHEKLGYLPPLRVTDLGCGTGRTILALINALQSPSNREACARILLTHVNDNLYQREICIKGLDASEGMLKVARSNPSLLPLRILKIIEDPAMKRPTSIVTQTHFELYDIQTPHPNPTNPPPPADALICSLVVEHLPSLPAFFAHLASVPLIRPSGLLLLSNMHPAMASGASPSSIEPRDPTTGKLITGAGFIDPNTGDKIRAAGDWAHTIAEVLDAGTTHGFELVGSEKMEEMRVEAWMLEQGLVDRRRGEKWARGGVMCWFGGVFRQIKAARDFAVYVSRLQASVLSIYTLNAFLARADFPPMNIVWLVPSMALLGQGET